MVLIIEIEEIVFTTFFFFFLRRPPFCSVYVVQCGRCAEEWVYAGVGESERESERQREREREERERKRDRQAGKRTGSVPEKALGELCWRF